jgi:hypothetical protein
MLICVVSSVQVERQAEQQQQPQQQQQEQLQSDKRLLLSSAAALPVQERIDRVKPLWRSLDAEARRRHLTVSLKELAERAAATDEECNNDPYTQLLGVPSVLARDTWCMWYCEFISCTQWKVVSTA